MSTVPETERVEDVVDFAEILRNWSAREIWYVTFWCNGSVQDRSYFLFSGTIIFKRTATLVQVALAQISLLVRPVDFLRWAPFYSRVIARVSHWKL